MTEITDLSPTDSSNTSVTGESLDGSIANMGRMDNTLQAILGMFGRWTSSDTIASAATTDIGAQAEAYLTVSGATTITRFGTVRAGTIRFLQFSGILTLTYNATSLILPGAASITTAAGDTAVFVSEGSGNWRCLVYNRASGRAVVLQVIPPSAGKLDVRRNHIVNGDMRVSQENGTSSGTTNGYYGADQWATFRVTSAGIITSQSVIAVTPRGGTRRYIVTISVPDASLAAGEYLTITQNLEGSNVKDFYIAGYRAGILRFGFKGPAGTYAARLGNSAADRSFVGLFTIAAGQANTDTVQEIAIPANSAGGIFLYDDGVIGLTLDIVLACGSTFHGVTGWQVGNILGTSAVSNGMGTAGAVFELFDVGLKVDTDATGVYGAYEVGEVDAVFRSERYWEKSYSAGTAVGTATFVGSFFIQQTLGTRPLASPVFSVEKCRASATITIYNPQTGATGSLYNIDTAASYATAFDYAASTKSFIVRPNAGTGGAAAFHWTANARLI